LSGDERAQERAFRSHDAKFFLIDFDALGERAEVVAAVASALGPHPLAGGPGKRLKGLWRDGRAGAINRVLGPVCVKAGLVAMYSATRLSSFSMGTVRPGQPVSPWRAFVQQV
jgi:hypothetical protein